MKKYKIFAIMGKSGSGKDTIFRGVVKTTPQVFPIIHTTTRPKRDYEAEGEDYYFLDSENFSCKFLNNSFISVTFFREWMYGIEYENMRKNEINLAILNPQELEILSQDFNVDLTIFYLTTSDKSRLLRQLSREENPDIDEIVRRYEADKKDFYELDHLENNYNIIELQNDKIQDIDDNIRFIKEYITNSLVEIVQNKYNKIHNQLLGDIISQK